MKTYLRLALFFVPALVAMVGMVQPLSSVPVFADTPQNEICTGIGLTSTTGSSGCGDNGAQVNNILVVVVNLLSVAVGVAAVIMIIIAGVRFATSGGEASKVAGAKNGLIYALVGLVVVALAQLIVRFVLTTVFKG